MIPCRIKTDTADTDERGQYHHVCERCGRNWYIAGLPSEWKGDPVYCKATPSWWEIGCWVTLFLATVGITKKRVQYFIEGPCCGCHQREEKLNTLGHQLALFLSGLFGRFRNLVNRYFARCHNRKADPPT